jgi:hypothetical protein
LDTKEKRIRQRLKDDFPHYSAKCLKIRSKAGDILPLELNPAQIYLHEQLEKQRRETGRVRALILKGRQQGCSTYVEGRFYWRVSHNRGARAFILTHRDDATANLFDMAKRYHKYCPDIVKPHTAASNARELLFDNLDSGYKIATAGGTGAGRSDTIQYFHGSEVAYWPNAREHVKGALQAVSNEAGTEIILESTSAGPDGLFYEYCMNALKGEGQYILVFIPWFWQQEYRETVPDNFQPTAEELHYAKLYGLDMEQLSWRRSKIFELGGIGDFRREYPATAEEAFEADAEGALWKTEQINKLRVIQSPDMMRIVVGVDPAVTSNPDSCETGIIVAGIGTNGHAYILEDASGKYSPNQWASKVDVLYQKWKADRVIGETNNGGDLVEVNIRTVNPKISYKKVTASRGKRLRAEPVAALYERSEVHHVGHLPALERQMVTWEPSNQKEGAASPDKIDAMVWAVWYLMLEPKPATPYASAGPSRPR